MVEGGMGDVGKGMNKESKHGVVMNKPLSGNKIQNKSVAFTSGLNDRFIERNQIDSLEVRVI